MSCLNKVRIVTEEERTRIWLDDQEVKGCVSASVDYEVNAIPVVRLELQALDIEEDIDVARVETSKVGDDDIENLGLAKRTYHVLKRGGVNSIETLVGLYNSGLIWRIRNFGKKSYAEVIEALKTKELI